MAISTPVLATPAVGASGAGAFTVTTASFTPTANAFLIAVTAQRNAANGVVPSTVSDTGMGLTWTKRAEGELFDAGAVQTVGVAIWTAEPGGSPASMTVTASWNAGNHIALFVAEMTGQHATPFVQASPVATGATAALTATLGASPAADSCVIAAIGSLVGTGITPDPDYTELVETSVGATPLRTQLQYRNGSADTTAAWSTLGNPNAGAAIEIAAAATGGQAIVGQMVVAEAAVDVHGWVVVGEVAVPL